MKLVSIIAIFSQILLNAMKKNMYLFMKFNASLFVFCPTAMKLESYMNLLSETS